MNKEITIRRWSEDDWEVFKAIRLEALNAHSDVFGASYNVESEKDDAFWKDKLFDLSQGAVFGLYDADTVIGLTAVFRDKNRPLDAVFLCMSYIRSEYRKNGLSDLLYRARIDWAKSQKGIRIISVAHREGNEASRRANQRWGFVFSAVKDEVFGNGETAKDYIYELKI
jgi:RimJ/RimL family protein N-acetyltransferase